MTIKEVYEFYFKNNNILQITTEMANGLKGKRNTFTFEEYKNYITGWENKEVVEIIFQSVYTWRGNNTIEIKPMETPTLYILYK